MPRLGTLLCVINLDPLMRQVDYLADAKSLGDGLPPRLRAVTRGLVFIVLLERANFLALLTASSVDKGGQ